MIIRWRAEWPHFVIIGAMFVAAALTGRSAPDRIPTHWNALGQVDRYGGKLEGLLLLPAVALSAEMLLLFIAQIDAGRANHEPSYRGYAILRFFVIGGLAVAYNEIQLLIHGQRVDLPGTTNAMVGVLFVVIGNLVGKARPNWFVGIRTPWTLSSKTSWDKTHWQGRAWFNATGLVILLNASASAPARISPVTIGVVAGGLGLALVVYSYSVWRTANDKIPPAGTSSA